MSEAWTDSLIEPLASVARDGRWTRIEESREGGWILLSDEGAGDVDWWHLPEDATDKNNLVDVAFRQAGILQRGRDRLHGTLDQVIDQAFQLCTGQLPWEAGKDGQAAIARSSVDPTPITEYRPSIHPQLAEVIMSCLATNADQRPQKISDFAAAIRKLKSEDV